MNDLRSMDQPPPLGSSAPTYDGRIGPLTAITITNAVFTFATLGIYRFWGKARLRRYLWSRVAFLGDRLEFTGRGIELFLGFLIALLFLIPVFGFPLAVELLFPESLGLQGLFGLLQTVIIYYLIQVALFRARRYRLTRTRWRGIRGGQSGSAFRYGHIVFAYSCIAGITLMLAYPWLSTAMQRYKIENTWLGDRKLSFHGRGEVLLKPWLFAWGALTLGFGLAFYFLFRSAMVALGGGEAGQMQGFGFLVLPLLVVGALAWIRYKVFEFRYFTSCTSVDKARFESKLSTPRIVLIYAVFALVAAIFFVLVFSVLTGIFGALGVASLSEGSEQIAQSLFSGQEGLAGTLFFVVFLVVFSLVFGVVRVLFLLHPLTKAVCGTLLVSGSEVFVELAQSRQMAPGRGEGLADALDVGELGF